MMSSGPLRVSYFLQGLLSLLSVTMSLHGGTVFETNSVWRVFPGTREASAPDRGAWRRMGYDVSDWEEVPLPVYYGESIPEGTPIAGMRGEFRSLFFRREFILFNPGAVAQLIVNAVVDDGMILWVNGRELFRYNLPAGELPHNTNALSAVPEPHVWQTLTSTNLSSLVSGTNVIAVQLFNVSLESSDILFDASLDLTDRETTAPKVIGVSPSPGDVTNLTQVTVTFSEPVSGVDAMDLMINGVTGTSVSGEGATWTFEFPQPPIGDVTFSWTPIHWITDRAIPPNGFGENSPGSTWQYRLLDPNQPEVSRRLPPAGSTVRSLRQVEVTFSESVEGVTAESLLLNGQSALAVSGFGPGPYVFEFSPRVTNGMATLRWADAAGIHDLGEIPQFFPGGSWTLEVNPDAVQPAIRISEVLAINTRGLRDEDQDTSAWIELYNAGSVSVNLAGWTLTDDPEVPDAWVFPDVTVGAGQFILIYADGKDRATNRSRLHTNFKLAVDGEYLGLYNLESPRSAVSEIRPGFPQQRADFSYGLNSANEWRYFSPPTPGAVNGESAIAGATEPVHFSVERGYFDVPFDVVLTCPTPGSTIRYTRDGSEPSGTNGAIYFGPVAVRATTVLRAAADSPGRIPSVIRTHTYLYALPANQRSLAALSIVTATNNLVGRTGIVGIGTGYYNPKNRGIAWERPISLEYIKSDNSGFQEDCGIRLQASDYFRPRLNSSSKFSWRFYFRGDYGAGKLRYPWFPTTSVSEFDVLVCRAGSNDQDNPFVKDEMMRRSFAACGQVSAQGTFAALYIDGIYKGFYNPCERVESGFLQAHHGGGKFWDVMSQSGVIDGDNRDFNSMLSFVKSKPMTNALNYQQMSRRLDVTNFIDYLIVNAWGFNGDWPHNNWRAGRERRAGALWRFYIWDAEFSLGSFDRPVTGNTFTDALTGDTAIASIHNRMKVNPEYKLLFADRIQRHFFNGGALSGAVLTNRFNALHQVMSKIIPGMSRGILSWTSNRPKPLFTHFHAQGFSAGSNAPVFRVHGGTVPAGYSLSMTNRGGEIWYTTDGADPRVPFAGTMAATARRYDPQQPPRLDGTVVVKARSMLTNSWSAVSEATFQVEDLGVPVRITEIMVDPPGGPEFEYVELTNPTDAAVNLSGYSFRGIGFQFPLGSILPPHISWVIGSDANETQFGVRYPGLAVAGRFKGSLANGGERVSLVDPSGNIVQTVDYQPGGGWPAVGSGTGRSLEIADPAADPRTAESWIASEVGGTPGRYRPSSAQRVVRISEILAQNEMAVEHAGGFPDWLELENVSKDPVVLDGWRLGLGDGDERFVIPAGTRLAAGEWKVIWWDSKAISGELHSGMPLPKEGVTVVLERADGTVADVFSYGPQIPDYSVGWVEGRRALLVPTPGQANRAATLANPSSLVINEWRANPLPGDDDFIEIYNRDSLNPAAVENLYLGVSNALFQIRSLTYIAAAGHRPFWADEHSGPDHLDFKLPATGGTLKLQSEEGLELDRVVYSAATEGLSRGRYPDGASEIVDFPSGPTPGAANGLLVPDAIQLHEILARSQTHSGAAVPEGDWIELRNPRPSDVSLAGYSLRVSAETNRIWTIPSGVTLAAGGHLQIGMDATTGASIVAGDPLNTGWELPDSGATIELKTSAGILADKVVFGQQLPGQSIGRFGERWSLLSAPTPGASNAVPGATASGARVVVNEWATGSTSSEDWIELFNGNDLPVDLGGYRLTDDPSIWAATHAVALAPFTFVPPHGFIVLMADGRLGQGPAHLNFSLSGLGESLRLVSPVGQSIDSATVFPLAPEISAGRVPDGGSFLVSLTRRSPGEPNSSDADGDGIPDDWELANGLNPTDSRDADADADGDGRSNRSEYRAGTNPMSAASRLELRVVPVGTNQLQLLFNATAFRSYSVQYRDDLGSGNWLRVSDVSPSTQEHWVEDIRVPVDRRNRWYRVVTPSVP